MTAELLAKLDGNRTLGEVLDAVRAMRMTAAAENVQESGARIARELLELGMVVPSPLVGSARKALTLPHPAGGYFRQPPSHQTGRP